MTGSRTARLGSICAAVLALFATFPWDAAEPCTSASVADVFAPTLLRLRLVLPN